MSKNTTAQWIDPARKDRAEGSGKLTLLQRAALRAWKADARKGFTVGSRFRIKGQD